MGSSFIYSSANIGLEGNLVNVEADISQGLPKFTIVGLPDAAVSESKDRVRAAIKNSDLPFPRTRVTLNLAPADIKKQGPAYDLPIAISILTASGVITKTEAMEKTLFLSELALDGSLRPVSGVLLASILARNEKIDSIVVAPQNAEEASLVDGIKVIPAHSLMQLVDYLRGDNDIPAHIRTAPKTKRSEIFNDMSTVRGQEYAKRALEITAAGGHNILLSGPPGSGKTMLARALPSILPDLNFQEALEITKISSVAGRSNKKSWLARERPFRSPHHTSSSVALIGGGTWPKPGEISLAHNGVLFLDEFPEFTRAAIENLRQPLEDGIVTISRAAGTLEFPAKFMLVAAMNPCPCGFVSDPVKTCVCTPGQVLKYQQKISGPVLDRIDLGVEVPRIDYDKLTSEKSGESSNSIRKRVQKARDLQRTRYKNTPLLCNSDLQSKYLHEFCKLDKESGELLKLAVEKMHLSARAYTRVLKVARTIADLSEDKNILSEHLAEALQYRPKGRE